MESSDSASWRCQTMRRRNSRLANDKKTAEARNTRRGGKRDNAPAARMIIAIPKKSAIALSLGLYGILSGSVISDWVAAYRPGFSRGGLAHSFAEVDPRNDPKRVQLRKKHLNLSRGLSVAVFEVRGGLESLGR